MKKMAGFAAAVFLGLMLTSCQGTQNAEQSGYKVFCRNAEATALREVQDRKSTRLNSSHSDRSRMPSSA